MTMRELCERVSLEDAGCCVGAETSKIVAGVEAIHGGTMVRSMFQYSGGVVFQQAINRRVSAETIVPK
jgi:hypothetical protein